MGLLRTAIFFVLFFVVSTSLATAQLLPQRFGESSPVPVSAGEDLNIVYSNANRKNQVITIHVYNGVDPDQNADIDIYIEDDGKGRHVFTVPNWSSVVLTFPDSADFTVPVVPSDGSVRNS